MREIMQSTARGAYCLSCLKTVIDFTGMSGNPHIEYLINQKQSVSSQFYKLTEIPSKKIPWLTYLFLVCLTAMMFSYKTNAQGLYNKFKEPVVLIENMSGYPFTLPANKVVSGNVIGENGIPVPYASVMIKGTIEGIAADSNGVFRLSTKYPLDTLEISSVGFETKHFSVTDNLENIQLNIALHDNIILSSNAVNTIRSKCIACGVPGIICVTNIWNSPPYKKPGKEPSITLFPNPVRQKSQVSICWKEPVNNNQLITIFNASGLKMMQETMYVSSPVSIAQIGLRVFIPGIYTIHITDTRLNKSHVAKLVIE